jgi:hypothetical protein
VRARARCLGQVEHRRARGRAERQAARARPPGAPRVPAKDFTFSKQISPFADEIVDPTFVYAGATDPRVPRSESALIVAALRERGVPSESVVAEAFVGFWARARGRGCPASGPSPASPCPPRSPGYCRRSRHGRGGLPWARSAFSVRRFLFRETSPCRRQGAAASSDALRRDPRRTRRRPSAFSHRYPACNSWPGP